jgi:hypothetical protein
VLLLQVYVDGVLYAAVLDDVVMQPLTGKLMAVLYRYSTPGQSQHMQREGWHSTAGGGVTDSCGTSSYKHSQQACCISWLRMFQCAQCDTAVSVGGSSECCFQDHPAFDMHAMHDARFFPDN